MDIKKTLTVLGIVLLLLVLGLAIFLLSKPNGGSGAVPAARPTVSLVVDPNIGNTPTPAPPEPGIAIPGWGSIILPAGTLSADVDLFNPEDNRDWYYLTYQLRLKQTGEVLFQTGLIPPGTRCTRVTLNRKLEPGSYDGVMHVQPYYIKDPPAPTNNADLDLKIIVR